MIHLNEEKNDPKGWLVGPWNSSVPIRIGYANRGISEKHYHAQTYEVYLVARGVCTATVDGEQLTLAPGDVLIVEPGEIHTFIDSSPDYFHFVIHTPPAEGDKYVVE